MKVEVWSTEIVSLGIEIAYVLNVTYLKTFCSHKTYVQYSWFEEKLMSI